MLLLVVQLLVTASRARCVWLSRYCPSPVYAAGRWSLPRSVALPLAAERTAQLWTEWTELLPGHEGTDLVRPKLGWSYDEKRLFQAGNGKESTRKRWSSCCVVRQSSAKGTRGWGAQCLCLHWQGLSLARVSPCAAEKFVGAWCLMHFCELLENTETAPFAP